MYEWESVLHQLGELMKSKSMLKTVSWLMVSGALIASTGWYESGSFKIGLLAALWACLLKTPIYWVHEIVWERRKAITTPKTELKAVTTPKIALWLRSGELQTLTGISGAV